MNEDVIEVSHEFEVDLACLATTNYKLTMEGIERAERDAMKATRESLKGETDRDTILAILDGEENFYADLRVAARNMAVVALITRVQHWAGVYARRIDPKRKSGNPLEIELEFLNERLGAPLTATEYFRKLADVRHSVIHADSQPNWYFKKPRTVNRRYVPEGCRVEVSESDLQDAIEKSVAQIKWYDEKLVAIHK